MLRTFCLVSMTSGKGLTPTVGPFLLGPGHERYTHDLRIEHLAVPEQVAFEGKDAYKLLARFDRVFLWHWPGGEVFDAIREAASQEGRKVRLGVIANFESVPNTEPWDGRQGPLWAVCQAHKMVGKDGGDVVVWQRGPARAVAVDLSRPGLVDAYTSAMRYCLESYRRSVPDDVFFDCHQPRPFIQDPNAPDWVRTLAYEEAYRRAWNALDYGMLALAATGGNNPDEAYDLGFAMVEHADRVPAGAWPNLPLDVGHGFEWSDAARAAVMLRARAFDSDTNVRHHLQTARTGTAFRLWHPGTGVAS